MRICFIGDSITNGYGDPEYRGWPAFLSAAARRGGTDITAYNLGIRSDTSSMVRARWQAEAEARLPAEMPAALVFAFGINDCARIDGVRRVEPAQSMANAEAILGPAKAWLPTIFIGPTPVDAVRDTPQFLPGKKLEISNDLIADMNRRLGTLCQEMEIPYVDIYTPLGEDAAFQAQHEYTRQFAEAVSEHGLLSPRAAEVTLKSGEKLALGGFRIIDEGKFNALPGEVFLEWRQRGWLHLVYSHLMSLSNWAGLVDRTAARES